MAAGAITNIPNPFIAVFLIDLGLVVLMAVVTNVISERVGMAGGAARGPASVAAREAMRLFEGCWTPAADVMTGFTVCAE